MFSHYKTHIEQDKARRSEMERKAQQQRAVREALAGRRSFRLHSSLMVGLGTQLIQLGASIQRRFGTEEASHSEPCLENA
jgi:hypothetical protein